MTSRPTVEDPKVRQAELVISRLLRAGVLVSVALVVAGTVLTLVHHPDYFTDRDAVASLTDPGAVFPHTLGDVAAGVLDGRGQALVALGLLVLIATPLLRVAVSIAVFARQRDRIFVAITAVVLALLLIALALGRSTA